MQKSHNLIMAFLSAYSYTVNDSTLYFQFSAAPRMRFEIIYPGSKTMGPLHMVLFVCASVSASSIQLPFLYFQLYSHLTMSGKRENWRQKDRVTGLIRQGQVKSHSSWQHTWTFNYALHKAIKSHSLLFCPTESTCYWCLLSLLGPPGAPGRLQVQSAGR